MTREEQLAVAIWTMREWGIDPTWIEHWRNVEGDEWIILAVSNHQLIYETNPGAHIGLMFKRPRVPSNYYGKHHS